MTILSLRNAVFAAGLLAGATAAYSQAIITTAVGGGFVNNAPALQSHLGNPQGVAVDSSGNVYIADTGHILKLDHATGILAAVAGGGSGVLNTADGPALSVRILPADLAFNASGNLLFLDGNRLRQLNLQQAAITTVAGLGAVSGGTGDGGPALNASLNSPQRFCQDASGNIYIVELAGYVRRIDAKTGAIATVAGNGGVVFSGDHGPATAAALVRPSGIAVDSTGNLYIADSGDLRIRKISAATQIITTIAGTGHAPSSGDGGSALNASFSSLGDLVMDGQNNLNLVDGNRVRRIAAATGIITTVAGNGTAGIAGDGGPAPSAELNLPAALALNAAGDLYLADTGNRRIRLVAAASGVITTIAGTSWNGDGGLAAGAVLTTPAGLAVNAAGDLFIAGGNVIRQVAQSTGLISTFAGGGTSTQDGIPALQAQLNPLSLAFDSAGNLVVGEADLIRRIDTAGTITTIAGTGVFGFSGDGGPATHAQIGSVTALAFDPSGNIVFADAGNKRVRRIDVGTGIITTIAGNGQAKFVGLGQSAVQTAIGNPSGVAVDATGNIYIGSVNAALLFKISAAGAISVAGGNTGCSYIGDGGLATAASMCQPSSLVLDASGNLFVGDSTCSCVRRIAADTGIVQTVAGNGIAGYSGDHGPATQAQLTSAYAIAVHGTTLYIADGLAGVVRVVTPDSPPALPGTPSFSNLTSSASFRSGGIAPGELISFFGHYLGPVTPVFATLGSDGRVTHDLGNVRVLFDGVPAPLIYVAPGQINAVAPYTIANGLHEVTVETAGGSVSSTSVTTQVSAPAIFPYAIVNQDGSLNSASHPAPVGSVVVMYGTGLGQTSPPGVDGALNPFSNFPAQVYPVAVSITGNPLFAKPVPMTVYYAAPAPGLVSGVCQINAKVPAGIASGELSIEILAGPNASPAIPFFVGN